MHVFLTGFMGSGKSHTGRRLADLLGRPFHDLDHCIERLDGRRIAEIFAQDGEAFFRQLEQRALQQATAGERSVIATGGGTPCFFDNADWMNSHGLTVYLRTPANVLLQRLKPEMAHRPLLQGLDDEQLQQFITGKLAEREPFYLKATVVYDQSAVEEDVARALYRQFSNIIGH